jgi:hypothetical protein
MNRLTWILLAVLTAVLAASVVCVVFETPFAEASIDWFSFFAGAFLASEGIFKILKYRKDPSSVQFCRFLRIFIGANVFLVHLAEFIWGPHAPAQTSALLGMIIDWTAFSFGIFLTVEGWLRISSSEGASPSDQLMRTMRVAIGSSVFTIHLLQFMRN